MSAGMYPEADPTAPGGMSQQALADELVERHGWTEQQIAQFRGRGKQRWNLRAWTLMIDAVIEARLAAEERQGETGMDEIESLMEEITEARAEAEVERLRNALLRPDPDTLDYIFDGHAGAGPSAAERWMNCTASLGASREFLEALTPNQQREFAVSSLAARQGTTAHAVAEAEALVSLGRLTQDEVDQTLLELSIMPDEAGEAYDDTMAEYITEYTDLITFYAQERGADAIKIEERVAAAIPLTGDYDGEVYEIRGSADCIAEPTDEHRDLVVADLKYGDGIYVDVDENPQIRIYALGALAALVDDEGNLTVDIENVCYHIVQPRLGGIKTWTESVDDLLDWRDEVLAPALTAALYGSAAGATFEPSEQTCQWCPARGSCAALAEDRMIKAAELFDVINEAAFDGEEFPETSALSDARLGDLLTQIKGLIKIHDDLRAEAQRRLYRGGSVPGWQLVNYSPPRKWAEGADEKLGNDPVWVKKMLSPTQALALNKHKEDVLDRITPLIETPDKKPVIAPDGDRRTAWEGRAPEAMFDIEEES